MSAADGAKLKALQGRLAIARVEREEASRTVDLRRVGLKEAEDSLERWNLEVKALVQEIDALTETPGSLVVSEHALLRWIERKHGVDLKAVAEEMLSDRARDAIGQLRTCKVTHDGMRLVVKDGVIITAEPA